ncbi:MAG: WecB/TagA/CpsF family glycosyltransferase [Tannerellaceae bacterium]
MQSIVLQEYLIAKDYLFNIIPENKLVINTINAYSWVNANRDPIFKKALQASDILLPDGIAIVFAARFLKNVKIKKIAGADLHEMILETVNKTSGKCFYLGTSQSTLSKIEKRINTSYPNIEVKSFSPPYKLIFSEEENNKMIKHINDFNPDILFVGMTAPKQEKWIHENKVKIQAHVITGIGAVFDFYAGVKKRPSQWMIKCGLEWLGRLIQDPKRLWRRYIIYNPIFIYQILKVKFSNKQY